MPNVYPIWTMILGGVVPFAAWLVIVKESPTEWKVPLVGALRPSGISEAQGAAASR
jgi:hypothetical protein